MKRRRPSIFDWIERVYEDMERTFRELEPFRGRRQPARFRDPFEEMIRRLEEEVPEELREYVREEETEEGKVRKYGPFIYGFTYSHEPGKEPEFKEFGNVKPGPRGAEPSPGAKREPLTDVMDQKDHYEIIAEIPGVNKEDINLNASEREVSISAETDDRRYYKDVPLEENIDPPSAKASYKNGVLKITVEKKGRKGTEIKLE